MKFCLITFLLVFVGFSLVKSGWHTSSTGNKLENRCNNLWNRAKKYDASRNRSIRRCVYLIQDKCPGALIIIEYRTTKNVKVHYTLWERYKEATFQFKAGRVKYKEKEKRGICADDDGGVDDCGFWWEAARWEKTENHIKERCVIQVKTNCPKEIVKVHEKKESKLYKRKMCDVTTYTYRYKDTEVIYQHYSLQQLI